MTICNWERQRTTPALPFIPRIIQFLGYAPYYPGAPLGNRLRAVRQAFGITQRGVAKLLGVDWTSVRDWETGKRQPIRICRARILSFLLGTRL